MKTSLTILALIASAATSFAHAADTQKAAASQAPVAQASQWTPVSTESAPKTRAAVRDELRQAVASGQLAHLNQTLYAGS